VAEVIFFQPRTELEAKQNLADFLDHCRNNLTLYEEQGGFSVDKWVFKSADRPYAMVFSKYSEKSDPYNFVPLDEPFMTFAKARVRYTQSHKQVKSIANQMMVLRLLNDALISIHGQPDVLKTDGIVLTKVRELCDQRYPGSDLRYRLGQQMELLYAFLRNKSLVPTLPEWVNPWSRGKSKAERTDKESRKWQEERCPSLHQMIALADCFARAQSNEDKYWSSVLTLLMFAPSRGGELQYLTVDCLHEPEKGRLGLRWYGEKGFGDTIKWVPKALHTAVVEAHRRLIEVGSPAREAAKFAHDNPGVFFRHQGCITTSDFSEDKSLNAQEFAHALNFGNSILKLLSSDTMQRTNDTRWSVLESSKWVVKLREHGNPTYRQLANFCLTEYQNQDWPYLAVTDRPVWDSLLLVRDREFHNDFKPRSFSWVQPSVNQINEQLSNRNGLKNPIKTIFQRFGIVDENGSEIALTSHQLRVWLSTNAERGGMDSWHLAKWAGRARIQDNRHYDLRTPSEREEQIRSVMLLIERPSALQAIKLNLPVSYPDLGLNRIGIAEVTEYGMCTHDYAMSPCTKGGECMTCKEHVCIKGMPKTLERIKRLEGQVESQFEKSKVDASAGAFGADRWVTHLGWKLAHIRTNREILESEKTPDGAILWIPPEHDPSPIKRALDQKNLKTELSESTQFDSSTFRKLLGTDNA
jgi:hypothetical protein